MKKLLLACLMMSVLALSISCKKDKDDEPKAGISFKVDGKAWQSTTALAQRAGGVTQIAATNADGTLQFLVAINGTGTFSANDEIMMTYQAGMKTYFADEELDPDAKIIITKYDTANSIIEGTFSFKAYDMEGNFVNITEGKITALSFIQQ